MRTIGSQNDQHGFFSQRCVASFLFLLLIGLPVLGFAATPKIELDWDDNTDSDLAYYNVYRSATSGGPYNKINTTAVLSSLYIDTSVAYGDHFYYVVSAVDTSKNESVYSNEVSISLTDTEAPSTPSAFSAVVLSQQEVGLSWQASTDNNAVAGYRIYRNGTLVSTVTQTGFTDTGLTAGMAYTYQVLAYDPAGNESARADSSSVTPSELAGYWPLNQIVTGITADASPHGHNATVIGNVLPVTGRIAGAALFDGTQARLDCASPGEIQALNNTLTLSLWLRTTTLPQGAVLISKMSGTAGFELRAGASGRLLFQVGDGTTAYTIETGGAALSDNEWHHVVVALENRTAVKLYVDGVLSTGTTTGQLAPVGDIRTTESLIIGNKAAGTAGFTGSLDDIRVYNRALSAAEVAALFEPAAPQNVAAVSGEGQVTLNWTANKEGDLAGYRVSRSTLAGGPYTLLTATLLTTRNYVDQTVQNGTTYYYVVQAVDTATKASTNSSEVAATPQDATPPLAPTVVTPTAGNARVDLTWTPNSEPDIHHYNVYRAQTSGGTYTLVGSTTGSTPSYADTGVTNLTTYYYVVQAVDTASNGSPYSAEVSVTPIDQTPVTAPTGINATAGEGRVNLTWTASTESNFSHYFVYRSTTAGGPYVRISSTPVTQPNYADLTVTNGVVYYYVVRAVNVAQQESLNSAEVFTMPMDVTPPSAPLNLKVRIVTN
jgi:fibronectin type 3 domain-containing protein